MLNLMIPLLVPPMLHCLLVAEDLLKLVCSTSYDCKQISLIVKIFFDHLQH